MSTLSFDRIRTMFSNKYLHHFKLILLYRRIPSKLWSTCVIHKLIKHYFFVQDKNIIKKIPIKEVL